MSSPHQFINMIEQISQLYSHELAERSSQFMNFCEEIKPLYDIEKRRVYNQYIEPFVADNLFLCDTSLLRVIKRSEIEDCHTKILEYIWSDAKCGVTVLSDFISSICDDQHLCELINMGNYKIINEYRQVSSNSDLNNKKVDLLIIDHNSRWFVAIENKVNSEVHNLNNTNISQLDGYYKFCKSKYRGYKSLFVLLSYRDNERYSGGNWVYADYFTLFKSLLPHSAANDIIKDYLKTIFTPLFDVESLNEYRSCGTLSQSVQFYNKVIRKTE